MRTDPPDNAIAAMLLLTALAVGLVVLVEFFARGAR
jgi:hypothetical protein